MANLQKLREELDAGHPVTGAYSADDSAASEEINAKNRVRINSISSAQLLVYKSQFALIKLDPSAEELRTIK